MVSLSALDDSRPLLDAAFEGGVTLYDTAYIYGGGENERGVGKWVNDRGIRDQAGFRCCLGRQGVEIE